MRRWTIIVPLKSAADRKSRLACHLTANERRELTEMLFERVVTAIAGCPAVRCVVVLAPKAPSMWTGAMLIDRGRGLSRELAQAALSLDERYFAVIHADLPRLTADDVSCLLAAADAQGSAIAPDRHGTGTNALALQSAVSFRFCFGPGSYARHAGQLPGAKVVDRPGLSFDLDTFEDLDFAIGAGLIPLFRRYVLV